MTLLAAAVVALSASALPAWQAGFARVAITPDRPMWMSGYAARTAPAEGKDTDLFARAAVFEDAAGRRLVLVALDLVGIDRAVSAAACKLIADKHRLGREAMAVACSHTHCGPVVRGNLRTMYALDPAQAKLVDDYGAALPGKILSAVDQAITSMRPVTLSHGTGAAGFAVNRRENKEPEVPALRAKGAGPKGPTDHSVPVLAARDGSGKVVGVVFGYACHATTLGYQKWNADYPGYAAAGVEAANPGAVALFAAGCGADQNPLPRKTVALAKEYGRQLAAAVGDVLAKPMTAVAPSSAAAYKEIALPLAPIPTREEFVKQSQSANKLEAGRAKMLLTRLDAEGSLPAVYPYPVQAWRLGDATMVLLGGEVVVDYALRLRRELGLVWVTGYANDVMAYIPSLRVLREGGYEGATSMVAYGMPTVWAAGVEEMIVAEVTRQVTAVCGGK
jgi:neutral ceramidase